MLSKKTYKEQIYQLLKEKILNKELERDRLYSEQYFAEAFQVSRTPVREALLQLQNEGYIDIVPNRGIKVVDCDLQNLFELCQMRDAIESFCAANLARRVKTSEIGDVLQKLEQNVSTTETLLKNYNGNLTPGHYVSLIEQYFLEFNTLLISPMQNRHFDAFQRMEAGRLHMLDMQTSYVPDRPFHAVHEHRRILDAISRGDPDAAAQECHTHMVNVFEAIKATFEEES